MFFGGIGGFSGNGRGYPQDPSELFALAAGVQAIDFQVNPTAPASDIFAEAHGSQRVGARADATGVNSNIYAAATGSQIVDFQVVATTLPAPQLRTRVAAASITLGGTMRAAGTLPPVVLLAASSGGSLTFASNCPGIKVEIDSVAGGTARGQATFRVSYNSGATWAHSGVTTVATYDLDGAATGVQLQFPTGTYGTDQNWEGTIATIRSSEGSSYAFGVATASIQPVFRDAASNPGGEAKDAIYFGGAQYLTSTDAAVLALFTNDPALTVMARVAYSVVDANGVWLSCADSAGTNNKRRFQQINTGSGRESQVWTNSSAGTGTHTSATDPLTGGTAAHNICWYGPGSNGSINLQVNGGTSTQIAANANIGTLTPNRVTIGAVHDNAADTFLTGYLYDLAVWSSQLDATARSAWHTAMAS